VTALTDAELARLRACKTSREWGAVCDEIRRVRGGEYPPDWYEKMLATGEMAILKLGWAS